MNPFTEIKRRLDGSVARFQCSLVLRDGDHVVLRYDFTGKGGEVAGVKLPSGTVTYAYYWCDRPYNVYHWLLPDHTTAGYYFNLADQTVMGDDFVDWQDLTVDILITPDGRCQVLDEDELPADLDPALRAKLEGGKGEIVRNSEQLVREIEEATRRWLVDSETC
jgi:predicted RNA-binding protein associated with RNAse of E/G family